MDADGDALVVWASYVQDGSAYGIYGQRFDAAGAKVGGEFQVNSYTTNFQSLPSVAMDADGDAIVVWSSFGQDGSSYGVYGQRFNSVGGKVGGEFQIHTYTTEAQWVASVALDANGDAMIVWTSLGQDGSGGGVFGQRFLAPNNNELVINTTTANAQELGFPSRATASDPFGNTWVVWASNGQDGSFWGVYGQRYNAAGAKVGGEFQINTFTTDVQRDPSVAVDADGDAIVVWISYDQDGSNYGVYGQRFNAAGAKVGGEFQVNTTTSNQQRDPSVAVDANGDALVAWSSFGQDGSGWGIFGQRFNSAGAKVGGEFQINTFTTSQQRYPSVAIDVSGNTFIAWQSFSQDGGGYGIYGQRFNSAGAKVGGEFQINTYTTNGQSFPSVAVDADGDALVVWHSVGQDGSGDGIYGQRFNSAGAKVGGEFQINTYTTGNQRSASVAMDADGDAFVVWNSYNQDGSAEGVYGQRFNSAGAKVGGEFQINTYATGNQRSASVAVDSDGDAFVVWQSDGQDGSSWGIFGQRFASLNPATKIASIQVNDGSAQRSRVTSLTVTFDSPVSFIGAPSAAFNLLNQTTSNSVTLSVALDVTNTKATLTFTGGAIDPGGSWADGRYTLTILASQFSGNGFDGGGGVGSNYVEVGSPTSPNKLFRLFGDSDGDGQVTALDFNAFRLVYGTSGSSIFDFDDNGAVAATDFNAFRLRYGSSV
jgi:hypothetical protein